MAHKAALSQVILACQDCFADAFRTRDGSRKEREGRHGELAEAEAFVALLVPTDNEAECGLHGGVPRSLVTTQRTAVSEVVSKIGPICRPCYVQLKKFAKSKKVDDSVTIAECSHAQCLQTTPCFDDPDACSCTSRARVKMHDEILGYIGRIEKAANELEDDYNVDHQLAEYTGKKIKIDPAVPGGKARRLMEQMWKHTNVLTLDGREVCTKPGRRFCIVNEGSDDGQPFECHHHKMAFYAPANCICTSVACSCENCILRHVKHSAEDYEDAVERLRLGILKPRRAPKTPTADPRTLLQEPVPATDGCAMPGVHKGKHLRNFLKAKKNAHNAST